MILICYDGSRPAKHAVAVAREICGEKPATLLHVWSPPLPSADSFGLDDANAPSAGELDRFALERAQAIAKQAQELATAAEVRVERSEESVWHTILEVADEVNAELVVVGSRGAAAAESHLVESISNAVIRHSSRPVLVVPDGDS